MNLVWYGLIYTAMCLVIGALASLLPFLFTTTASSIISPMIPPLVAAWAEGSRAATNGKPPFESAQAWRAAGWMTVVATAVSTVILFFTVPGIFAAFLEYPEVLGIFLGTLAGVLLVNRFALTAGYRVRSTSTTNGGQR